MQRSGKKWNTSVPLLQCSTSISIKIDFLLQEMVTLMQLANTPF